MQRQSHRVHGEVTTPEIFVDRAKCDLRLRRLWIDLAASGRYLCPYVARKKHKQTAQRLVYALNDRACFFEILLKFEDVPLNRQIQVTNGKSTDNVANGSARKVEIHLMGSGNLFYCIDCTLLVRRKPASHHINVVGHLLSLRTLHNGMSFRTYSAHTVRQGQAGLLMV